MTDLTINRVPEDETRAVGAPRNGGSYATTTGALPLVVRTLQIAKRWRWMILGIVTVSLILGLLVTLLMTPQYTATSTLEIQREGNRLVQIKGSEPETQTVDTEFYQTQYGLLQSQSLAERVATDLRLYADAGFFEMYGADDAAEQVRAGGATANSQTARQALTRRAGTILLEHIGVSPVRLSRLVEVRLTSPDPQFSARALNAWNRLFTQTTLERRFEATSYARNFLERRLEQSRTRLEQSERQLVAYAAQQQIVNLPGASMAPGAPPSERPLVAENLAAMNAQLNEATAARVAAQSRLRSGGGTTVEALQNQAISVLRERRAGLAADRARLLSQFEADYPPVQMLASQIAELDRSIAREEGRVGSTLQSAYQAAAARENELRSRVQQLQGELVDLRGRTIQYNIYQRDADTNRQLYDALLQRYKEVGVGGVGINNVAVVDQAQVPTGPSSPNLLANLLLALLIGGAASVGLALALEQIDETISNPGDVERALGLPLIGTIPIAESDDPGAELEDRKSPLVEAYLSVQTRLAFTTDHGIPRSLTVTSTGPAEGKTTTTVALAQSLVRTGRKVVLVDADMRSPSLHHRFGVANKAGLSNFLSGSSDLNALILKDFANGVALIPAGPPPPNAAELLTGARLGQLIDELSQRYDHVILDVPPVMGLADTPLIASRVEGVIFVVQSHATRETQAKVAVNRLQDAKARVLGVLVTKFDAKRAHYGYGYDYGYGYGENGRAEQS